MNEHPILFNSEMVRAILDGRKSQTRRVIRPQPEDENGYNYWWKGDWDTRGGPRAGVCTHGDPGNGEATWTLDEIAEHCPYGKLGDLLWVREGFQIHANSYSLSMACGNYLVGSKRFKVVLNDKENRLLNNRKYPHRKTSGRFMYKSLARIWLEITGIRIERVKDITREDAWAEGITEYGNGGHEYANRTSIENFAKLWDSINAKRGYGWDVNPWVWVIEFKRISCNALRKAGYDNN